MCSSTLGWVFKPYLKDCVSRLGFVTITTVSTRQPISKTKLGLESLDSGWDYRR